MDGLMSPNMNVALLHVQQAEETKKQRELERIDGASKDFEAVFFTEMMKPMFENIKTNDTFGGGKGEDIFNGMVLQEYGKLMAETSSVGIADQVRAHLLKVQEHSDKMNMTASQENTNNNEINLTQ